MDEKQLADFVKNAEKRSADLFERRMRDPVFRALVEKFDDVVAEPQDRARVGLAP